MLTERLVEPQSCGKPKHVGPAGLAWTPLSAAGPEKATGITDQSNRQMVQANRCELWASHFLETHLALDGVGRQESQVI